jgi:hypothetical protein
MLSSLRYFDQSEIAQERLRIINFYDKYGEKATKEAFKADRKLIYVWRQKLKSHQNSLVGLIPHSTKPKTVRQMTTNPLILVFIKDLREKRPRIGKEKIKPLLDKYCLKAGISSIAESTIGKVIKRKDFFFQKQGRIYHQPGTKWEQNANKKQKRLRIKHAPKPKGFGYIVSDTIERITDGIKDYFYCAIDAKLKFALTLEYKNITSVNMKDFYFRFKKVYPAEIKVWQSDNGSENLGVFDQELERDQIPHLFIYPRCPKINTFIERYNRTVQEEYLDWHQDELIDLTQGNQLLADWNIYYNTKRRHHSLGLKSPMDYFIDNGGMSQKSLTYTINCSLIFFLLLSKYE